MLKQFPNLNKIRRVPQFAEISDRDIYENSGIRPLHTYKNDIFWTPKFYLQKDISQEFKSELKKFKHLEEWTQLHKVALTQLILTEAIRDTSYEISYNHRIQPVLDCPFHGTIDMLIYNNEENAK